MTAPTAGRSPAPSGVRRHAWLAVLVVGAGLFVAVERTLVSTDNPNFVPSAILLGAAVVPAAFLTFVYSRRLEYHVPVAVVLGTAFLAGVIGTVVAGTLEYDTRRDLGFLPMVGVGLIEETSKLLVPLVVLLWARRRYTRADGLLLGVAAGAGFAALETMGYGFTELISSRGSITDTVDILLLRGVMSPAGHMSWTGITASALFAAAAAGWRPRYLARFGLAYVVAVALHTAWDSQHTTAGTAVVAVLSLGVLGWTAHEATGGRRPGHRGPAEVPALDRSVPSGSR
ncbi:PrsW family glutamic-type intramembrane protease [Modestobacter sp. NPDC049651]|uniref:PrsW family intramembrane metalloprotease n=1 Tax=unclassified Modestobacter TaxID=2643866 RepID=UPI003406CF4C